MDSAAVPHREVFITGGSGDIGRVIVARLASSEMRVSFQYCEQRDVAEDLNARWGAVPIAVDFSAKNHELPDWLKPDIVVLAHGVNVSRELVHEISDEDWQRTLLINLTASFEVVRHVLPGMRERRWGRIIAINSIYGLRASVRNLPYAVSKHGLRALIKTVAAEYAAEGITANEICPGPVESSMLSRVSSERAQRSGLTKDTYLAKLVDSIPTRQLVLPSEIADIAAFLVSASGSSVNGASLVVDGGLTAT